MAYEWELALIGSGLTERLNHVTAATNKTHCERTIFAKSMSFSEAADVFAKEYPEVENPVRKVAENYFTKKE